MADVNRKYRLRPVLVGNSSILNRIYSEPSAIIQIEDTDGGFLTARLTTAQRDAIIDPATGVLIWNTDTEQFEHVDGSGAWVATSSGGGGGGAVSSVFGRTGAVVSVAGDYAADQITVTPAGNLTSVDVQAALQELQTDIDNIPSVTVLNNLADVDTATNPLNVGEVLTWTGAQFIPQPIPANTGGIDDVLAIGQNLSTNRTITVGDNTLTTTSTNGAGTRTSEMEMNPNITIISHDDTTTGGDRHRMILNSAQGSLMVDGGPQANMIAVRREGVNLTIDAASDLQINGNAGTTGQVLTSQGSAQPPVWATPTGGASGIDDVLAVSQSLTTNRTINFGSNIFDIYSNNAIYMRFADDLIEIEHNGAQFQIGGNSISLTTSLFGNISYLYLQSSNTSAGGYDVQLGPALTIEQEDGTAGSLRFHDRDTTATLFFNAPVSITSDVTFTLPATDGSAGQVLSTNGSGVMSWTANEALNVTAPSAATVINANVGEIVLADVRANNVTVNAPSSPVQNDRFGVSDAFGGAATLNVAVDFIGSAVNGSSDFTFEITDNNQYVEFIYVDATVGWIIKT